MRNNRRDSRCTLNYGWSVMSPVNGGSWGHWRTREDAEKADALGRFLSMFNHPGSLVCHHDWWPEELDETPCKHSSARYDHHRAGMLCNDCGDFQSDYL